jgi:hypothetical protein
VQHVFLLQNMLEKACFGKASRMSQKPTLSIRVWLRRHWLPAFRVPGDEPNEKAAPPDSRKRGAAPDMSPARKAGGPGAVAINTRSRLLIPLGASMT